MLDEKATRQEMLTHPTQCPVCGERTMTPVSTTQYVRNEKTYLRGSGGCSNMRCALNGGDQVTMPG